MEEEKAAAYYDELTRKGEGAAKFKQGLGFSSSSSSDPFSRKPSQFSLSSFVRASNSSSTSAEISEQKTSDLPSSSPKRDDREDRARVLGSIHDKLSRGSSRRRRSPAEDKERDDLRYSSRKSRDRDRDRERRRSRSNTPPRVSRRDRDRGRERDGDRDRDQGRDRERDSGRERDRDRGRGRDRDRDRGLKEGKSGGGKSYKGVDYSKIIEGYAQMMPAERVKAKMKLQLSQTAANDTAIGTSSAWERFDFNKDAPLDDDDEETEVAEDDISVVKNLGRSFRFSAVEARREKEVQAAHDQAMFGAPVAASSPVNDSPEPANEAEEDENDAAVGNNGNHLNSNPLLSDKVLSLQQGSWRDRARRIQTGS